MLKNKIIIIFIITSLLLILQGCNDKKISSKVPILEGKDISRLEKKEKTTESDKINYSIADYMTYDVESSYAIYSGDKRYEFVISKDKSDEYLRDVKVFVSGHTFDNKYLLSQVIAVEDHVASSYDNEGIYLHDINFDGNLDVVIFNGHHGASGIMTYSGYLLSEDKYVYSESFSNILAAGIDTEKKEILSWWKSGAASHSHGKYKFIDGEFVVVEILSIYWAQDEDAKEGEEEYFIAKYHHNTYTNKELSSQTIYTTEEYKREELEEKFCSDNSEWAIYSDKWDSFAHIDE